MPVLQETPTGLRMQPQNEAFFGLFQLGRLAASRSGASNPVNYQRRSLAEAAISVR